MELAQKPVIQGKPFSTLQVKSIQRLLAPDQLWITHTTDSYCYKYLYLNLDPVHRQLTFSVGTEERASFDWVSM